LHIPLAQGRVWDQAENHRGAAMIVINKTLAHRFFPNGDAIGHTLKFPELTPAPPFRLVSPEAGNGFLVIGVVGDKLDDGLSKPILPEAFVPYTIAMGMYTQILVHSEVPPLSLLHAIRVKVNSVDHDQQVNGDVRDLEHWITRMPEWARGQLIAWLFGGFAVLALILASVGLYSVVSYSVVQRTNEFGIRVALGAKPGHVLGIVFRSMIASVGAGIVVGITLTLALNKLMATWDAESARSPMLLLVAVIVLTSVAALACAVPARRAASTDPMKAIRYE